MKHFILSLLLMGVVVMSGCTSTSTSDVIVSVYKDGQLIEKTETKQSSEAVGTILMKGIKDKTVMVWDNSFTVICKASVATAEDPIPTLKLGFGKLDKGILLLPSNVNLTETSEVIKSIRASDISVTATGVKASNDTTDVTDKK